MTTGPSHPRKPVNSDSSELNSSELNLNSRQAINSITCVNFEDHLHTLLDERAPILNDKLLQQHANQCPPCASILADYEALDDSVSNINIAALSKLAGVDLTAEPVPIKRPANNELRRAIGMTAAVAAILMITIGLGVSGAFSDSSDSPSPHVALSANVAELHSPAESTGPTSVSTSPSPNSRPFGIGNIGNFKGSHLLGVATPLTTPDPQKVHSDRQAKMAPVKFPKLRTVALRVAFDDSEIEAIEPYLDPVGTMQAKNAESWQQISEQLEPVGPYLWLSKELPGIRSIHESVRATFNLIQQSLSKPKLQKKELDFSGRYLNLAAV